MNDDQKLEYNSNVVLIPSLLVFIIWLIYWIEIRFGFNFNKFGVFPRDIIGLRGVLLTHFIHSNTSHLFNNSVPLFVLTWSLFYFYKDVAYKVLVFGALSTGSATWIIARESYHIGASGIVYALFSFVFFSGIIRKHYRLMALSLSIIFLYGSMIWYILPIKEGMSWEGHLSGFLVGLVFSIKYRKKGMKKEEYHFSATDFDTFFDEDGNLIQQNDEEEIDINSRESQ